MTSENRTARARALRKHQTRAEALLWQQLRARRLDGLKFRRQHRIDRYFVDFACEPLRLAIELDGGVHAARQREDDLRQSEIEAVGWFVLRFPNAAVTSALPTVLAAIREQARIAGASLAAATPLRKRSIPRPRLPKFRP